MIKNRNLISSIISILVVFILIQIEPLKNGNSSELIGVSGAFIILFFIIRFVLTLFYESEKGKLIEQEIRNKKEIKEIKEALYNSLLEYENAKNSFKYFSNEKLLSIYSDMKEHDIQNMECLALEEIMVEKGLLSHSEMHEKLHMIKKQFNGK